MFEILIYLIIIMIIRALHRHFHGRDLHTFRNLSHAGIQVCVCTGSYAVPSPQSATGYSLQWRHNKHHGVSNHQPHDSPAIVYSDADQRKNQSFASLAFVRGIHRGPVNSPHKLPVTQKMFPFDDVIMCSLDNFLRTIFRISSVLAGVMALRYRLPDQILVNFNRDLDLEFSRSNMKFTNLNLSQNVPIVTKQKAVIWIEL